MKSNTLRNCVLSNLNATSDIQITVELYERNVLERNYFKVDHVSQLEKWQPIEGQSRCRAYAESLIVWTAVVRYFYFFAGVVVLVTSQCRQGRPSDQKMS